ncbi:MAG: CDP-glycerol glycerophosphotransferase family protein, partial [Solirubrobacterales bacterium]
APHWVTIEPERVILIVLRTIATVSWLLEIISELLPDPRIQVIFTMDEDGSAFDDGVFDALREARGRFIPWSQAVNTEFDLAIAASHNGSLERLRSPLLLTSHGIGFGKTNTIPDDGAPPLPQISSRHRPRATVALSHAEQIQQWRSPNGEFRTAVIGDPWIDRLQASRPQRWRYREALGVSDDQKVVVVSSTWRRQSLFAERPDLLARLVTELPADEYRVAAIVHPNIWSGHGPWQVQTWLREATEGGLQLLPPRGGWRGALVAADCLIGDHGSVTFYAAALGVPILLGAYGTAEMTPGTPLEQFGRRAPRLDLDAALREQIENTEWRLDPERYGDLAARCFANPGKAMQRLRDVIYDLIDLDTPARLPRVLAVPLPRPYEEPVTAHLVLARRDDGGSGGERVILERFPAHLEPAFDEQAAHSHLAVDDRETDERLRQSADVFVRRLEPHRQRDEAPKWIQAQLASYPGCQMAVASLGDGLVALAERGEGEGIRRFRLERDTDDPAGIIASAIRAATALGFRVRDNSPEKDRSFELCLGETAHRVFPIAEEVS